MIRRGSSILERNQSEAKVAAERAPHEFDLSVDPLDYPVVDSYGIPLNDEREVQKVLRDLTKLQQSTKSFDLFTFPAYNDKLTTLVNVPCSTRMFRFRKNVKRSKWVARMLDAILPPNEVEQEELGEAAGFVEADDEVGFVRDDAARWLLTYLGKESPDEFVKGCETLARTSSNSNAYDCRVCSHYVG